MDVPELRRLKPQLSAFLKQFDDCFARKDTRAHLAVYVTGQLSDLPARASSRSPWRPACPPRPCRSSSASSSWDDDRMRDRLHADRPHASTPGRTPSASSTRPATPRRGTRRRACSGSTAAPSARWTTASSRSTWATPRDDFHCLLDGELFLPESWSDDRDRCREAGIPDDVVYRPKWQIALELYDRAVGNGVHFDWLTFDEGYGSKPEFLRA